MKNQAAVALGRLGGQATISATCAGSVRDALDNLAAVRGGK